MREAIPMPMECRDTEPNIVKTVLDLMPLLSAEEEAGLIWHLQLKQQRRWVLQGKLPEAEVVADVQI